MFLKPFSSWRTFCHNYQTNALVTAEGVEMFRVLIGEISMSGAWEVSYRLSSGSGTR